MALSPLAPRSCAEAQHEIKTAVMGRSIGGNSWVVQVGSADPVWRLAFTLMLALPDPIVKKITFIRQEINRADILHRVPYHSIVVELGHTIIRIPTDEWNLDAAVARVCLEAP